MHLDGASNKHLQRQNAKTNMDEQIIKAIEAIIKRGNDAEIRRKGDGYIVLEVKKAIKYKSPE